MVSVDNAWGDDLVGAVDDFDVCVGGHVRADFCDFVALDEDIGLEDLDMVVIAVNESGAISQEGGWHG